MRRASTAEEALDELLVAEEDPVPLGKDIPDLQQNSARGSRAAEFPKAKLRTTRYPGLYPGP